MVSDTLVQEVVGYGPVFDRIYRINRIGRGGKLQAALLLCKWIENGNAHSCHIVNIACYKCHFVNRGRCDNQCVDRRTFFAQSTLLPQYRINRIEGRREERGNHAEGAERKGKRRLVARLR